MIRLRQVALVAQDLGDATDRLTAELGLGTPFRDPGVGEFGLHNVVFPVGHDFLEVVSPTQPGTTAGRLLDKRAGDGGYMVIVRVDDIERRRARLADLGVRVVWTIDLHGMSGTHLHPKDVGGAILSIDAAPEWDTWEWAGPSWRDNVRTDVVSGIAGVVVGAADPAAMAARWGEVLDAPVDGTVVQLDGSRIVFEPAGARGDGLDAVEVTATDRSRAGERCSLVGVEVRFV